MHAQLRVLESCCVYIGCKLQLRPWWRPFYMVALPVVAPGSMWWYIKRLFFFESCFFFFLLLCCCCCTRTVEEKFTDWEQKREGDWMKLEPQMSCMCLWNVHRHNIFPLIKWKFLFLWDWFYAKHSCLHLSWVITQKYAGLFWSFQK